MQSRAQCLYFVCRAGEGLCLSRPHQNGRELLLHHREDETAALEHTKHLCNRSESDGGWG